MPLFVKEDISSCNDEPEAEAHCNQNTSSQSSEIEQAVCQEPKGDTVEETPVVCLNPCEGSATVNSSNLRGPSVRSPIPVIEGAHCLPAREAEDISEIMTFSDAEDDQPNKKQNLSNGNEVVTNGDETEAEAVASPSPSYSPCQSSEACALPEQVSASNSSIADDKDNTPKDSNSELAENLDSEKVMEKLQQIQGYINQTSNAMKALEKDGNLTKLEQHKTLSKVMKELEASKEKLVTRLVLLNEKSMELMYPSQEHGNSQRVGVVGSMNEVVNPFSMQERLAYHETEQGVLSTRLRESVAKRQELVARYKNTRERLSNLKKQRQGLVQEERSLLQSQGAPEDPYEGCSIPEAETWTVEQLKQAVHDFQGLKNKVIHLHSLYETQASTVDANDEEAQANIERKKVQIQLKNTQIDGILAQLNDLLQKQGELLPIEENGEPVEGLSEVLTGTEEIGELTDAVAVGEALHASTDDVLASSDIAAKQEHLNKLRSQLNNMKKLLDETHSIRMANVADLESRKGGLLIEKKPDLLQSTEDSSESELLSFNGQFVRLSEEQKAHPEIAAKSQQLRQAKQRLAKMEEVMDMIAMAREQNKPLNEVLTPEYMAILEDAQNEFENPIENGVQNRNIQTEQHTNSSSQLHSSTEQTFAGSDPESDHESAKMELEPNRNPTLPTPSVLDELVPNSKLKESYKIHNGNIWNGVASNSEQMEASGDTSVMELQSLQLELFQKKNTLEVLMNRMGKSSGFFPDNSDNMSVNISDGNSDSEEIPRIWNGGQPAQSFRHENRLAEEVKRIDIRPNEPLPSKENHVPQKNRNKLSSSHLGDRQTSGLPLPPFATINNFSAHQGVRPKLHPHEANGRTPNVTWEIPPNKNEDPIANPNEDVQKMMSSALSQLSSLQQTVNHLYGSMQQTKPTPLSDGMGFSTLPASFPPHQMYSSFLPQPNLQGVYGGPYPYNYDPHTNEMNSQGRIMGALQQCLSQLNLHSMEIQGLSKQLQVIVGERGKVVESYPKNREENVHVNPFRIRQPEAPFARFHFNEPEQIVMQAQTNGQTNSFSHGRRVSFPRANNIDDLDFGNQNFCPPFDGCGSADADNILNRQINRPRTIQDCDPSYASVQPLQSQSSTSILNNKVLPGTRANNYWDNFRSYSHQNPLSSTRKSNSRGDNFSGPIHSDPRNNSRTKEPIQSYPNRLHENRRQNITSRRNDHVNRSSEKNSSFGVKRAHSRGNFPASVIVPEPQYPAVRQAKHENRREDRFFQPTATDSAFVPSFPSSNVHCRSFDEYRASRGHLREDKTHLESRSELMKQAEDLMQSQHPQFLIKLFSYLSKITDKTDQHVALELLKELSNQDANFHNQWMSSFSSLNNEENRSSLVANGLPTNKNESSSLEKTERSAFSNTTDLDISEAFQCTGEDFQVKERKDMYKNLTAGVVDHSRGKSLIAEKSASPGTSSSISSFYTPQDSSSGSRWKRSKDHVNFFDTSVRLKDKSPEQLLIPGLEQVHNLSESNNLTAETTPNLFRSGKTIQPKSLVAPTANAKNKHSSADFGSRTTKDFQGQKQQMVNNESPKDGGAFDFIIAAVFRKIMDYFKGMSDTNESGDRFLDGLHLSILKVIEDNSKKSYSPDFLASIENRLRRTLRSFKGKRICEIQQELPAAVSQVLIHQYCSFLYHENLEYSGSSGSPEYFMESNSQSNIYRQRARDPRYISSDAVDGEFTEKHSVKAPSDASYNRHDVPAAFHGTRSRSNGCKFPERRQTNSKSSQANKQKCFDFTPVDKPLYFDQMNLIDSPEGDEPEGYFALRPNQENKPQWSNIILPPQNGDSNIVHELTSLPVHDLAEADQSRNKLEVEVEDAKEAVGFAGLPLDRFDLAVGYSISHRQENVPEQGLDKVPTKLRSPLQIPGFDDDLFETFEELSYRHPRSPPNNIVLPCAKFSIQHPSEKSP